MPEPMRKDWLDIGFTVIATLGNPSPENDRFYLVEFVAYRHVGHTTHGGTPLFAKKGDPTWAPVDTIEESEPYLHGDVKWDGCSNWSFDEQERCVLHGCNRQDLFNLGEVMARCWDWADELIMD